MAHDSSLDCRLVDALSLPAYDLGPGHPFAADRQQPLYDLMRRMELYRPEELLASVPAGVDELRLAHEEAYIRMVEATSAPSPGREEFSRAHLYGLGTVDNPIGPNQHQAAAAMCGATLACVREVLAGRTRHAFNPAGGLHHAGRRRASGFCVYNDLVVGIQEARRLGAERVLYVDFDVHHGDGVEQAYWDDPSVLTLSFHQSPETLFPGTGSIHDLGASAARGTSVNMPLAPFTGDSSWLHSVESILPPVARRFRPDFILSQHGCDPHREDPLAQLQLSTAPMARAAAICRDLSMELCQGRWVATGGGGYQPVRVIPRAWALVWMEMSGRRVPDTIDEGWLQAWQEKEPRALAPRFYDDGVDEEEPLLRAAAKANRETAARLLDLLELE